MKIHMITSNGMEVKGEWGREGLIIKEDERRGKLLGRDERSGKSRLKE